MYQFYLKYFDDESKFLQILCVNCNLTKRMNNKEGRVRPNLFTFLGKYQQSLIDDDMWELNSFCNAHPQFEPIKKGLKIILYLYAK
jgi:hypothetical protein